MRFAGGFFPGLSKAGGGRRDGSGGALAALGLRRADAAMADAEGAEFTFIQTGGVEADVVRRHRCRMQQGRGGPVLLIAHPAHSALAASLEVLAQVRQEYIVLDGSATKTADARTIAIRPNLRAKLRKKERIPWSPDCMRHTFATMAYELTKDAAAVAADMGHAGTGFCIYLIEHYLTISRIKLSIYSNVIPMSTISIYIVEIEARNGEKHQPVGKAVRRKAWFSDFKRRN